MTKRVEWKKVNTMQANAVAKERNQLAAIVRFLARRAAERTWNVMRAKPVDPSPQKGRSP